MQFPVPQFTDVEDKIIGPLTLKQFGIIFGTGAFVFLGYTIAGKNLVVLIVLAIIFGLPAIGFAFVKYNGRPIYNTLGQIVAFILSEKALYFHKEVINLGSQTKLKDVKMENQTPQVAPAVQADPAQRLKEVSELLKKQQLEESQLVGKIKGY